MYDLVHEAMLDVDTPRIGSREISNELLKRRRVLQRINIEDSE
jgi:hypothetical protein